jgi:hypothetical protein
MSEPSSKADELRRVENVSGPDVGEGRARDKVLVLGLGTEEVDKVRKAGECFT